jgi:ABC-type nickel/cobalt efflux system permease component RcnA
MKHIKTALPLKFLDLFSLVGAKQSSLLRRIVYYTHTHTHTLHTHTNICAHTHTHTHIYICTHIHTHTHSLSLSLTHTHKTYGNSFHLMYDFV